MHILWCTANNYAVFCSCSKQSNENFVISPLVLPKSCSGKVWTTLGKQGCWAGSASSLYYSEIYDCRWRSWTTRPTCTRRRARLGASRSPLSSTSAWRRSSASPSRWSWWRIGWGTEWRRGTLAKRPATGVGPERAERLPPPTSWSSFTIRWVSLDRTDIFVYVEQNGLAFWGLVQGLVRLDTVRFIKLRHSCRSYFCLEVDQTQQSRAFRWIRQNVSIRLAERHSFCVIGPRDRV